MSSIKKVRSFFIFDSTLYDFQWLTGTSEHWNCALYFLFLVVSTQPTGIARILRTFIFPFPIRYYLYTFAQEYTCGARENQVGSILIKKIRPGVVDTHRHRQSVGLQEECITFGKRIYGL